MTLRCLLIYTSLLGLHAWADLPLPDGHTLSPADVSTISTAELSGYDSQPEEVKSLINRAIALTQKKLTYRFGSSDPTLGGMDCSGTIYRLLQDHGIKDTPRQSDEMCLWVRTRAHLHRTEDAHALDHEKFNALKPGDLLFWAATDARTERKLPITHVMLYLGKRTRDNKPIIFGSSDGRSYEGQRRCGVSIFDFKLPKAGDKTTFYGYGPVPTPEVNKKNHTPAPPRKPVQR